MVKSFSNGWDYITLLFIDHIKCVSSAFLFLELIKIYHAEIFFINDLYFYFWMSISFRQNTLDFNVIKRRTYFVHRSYDRTKMAPVWVVITQPTKYDYNPFLPSSIFSHRGETLSESEEYAGRKYTMYILLNIITFGLIHLEYIL